MEVICRAVSALTWMMALVVLGVPVSACGPTLRYCRSLYKCAVDCPEGTQLLAEPEKRGTRGLFCKTDTKTRHGPFVKLRKQIRFGHGPFGGTKKIDYYLLQKGHYRNGLKHGQWDELRVGTDASKRIAGNYRNGLRNGPWRGWYVPHINLNEHTEQTLSRDGKQIAYKCQFSDGTGSEEHWEPSGMIASRGSVVDGKKHGEWEEFYPANVEPYRKDKLKTRGNFLEGKKHGEWTSYYPSGRPKTKQQYENGASGPFVEIFTEDGAGRDIIPAEAGVPVESFLDLMYTGSFHKNEDGNCEDYYHKRFDTAKGYSIWLSRKCAKSMCPYVQLVGKYKDRGWGPERVGIWWVRDFDTNYWWTGEAGGELAKRRTRSGKWIQYDALSGQLVGQARYTSDIYGNRIGNYWGLLANGKVREETEGRRFDEREGGVYKSWIKGASGDWQLHYEFNRRRFKLYCTIHSFSEDDSSKYNHNFFPSESCDSEANVGRLLRSSPRGDRQSGEHQEWWPDGHKKVQGSYADGFKVGEWIEWEKRGDRYVVKSEKDYGKRTSNYGYESDDCRLWVYPSSTQFCGLVFAGAKECRVRPSIEQKGSAYAKKYCHPKNVGRCKCD